MAETLNLVNADDSLSCKYEISKFPDGQQSIRIIEDEHNTFNRLKGTPTTIHFLIFHYITGHGFHLDNVKKQ
jgi:hypothetical protein